MRRPRPGEPLGQRRSSRSLFIALLLACATLITLDYHGGTDSPMEPVRRAMGEVFGPVESAAASAVRPITSIPDWFSTRGELRHETGMPVHVADDPLTSVAMGAAKCVEEFEGLQQVFVAPTREWSRDLRRRY